MTGEGPGVGDITALKERLHEINHWWPKNDNNYQPDRPGSIPATKAWDFYKADYFLPLKSLAWNSGETNQETQVLAIAGPENTGKTTLLSQMVRLFVDEDFRNLLQLLPESSEATRFARNTLDLRAAWATNKYGGPLLDQLPDLGADRVLYLPLQADPSFQLRPEKQLREAIEYYESEVLDGAPEETKHYVFIDDIHTISGDADELGWGELIADLVDEVPTRKIILTTVSEQSVEKELYDPERDKMRLDPDTYETGTVLPLKFRDYLQRRYPIFEGADTRERVNIDYTAALTEESGLRKGDRRHPDTYRISGTPLRKGLQEAVKNGATHQVQEALEEFEEDLDTIYDLAGRGAKDSPRAWIRNAQEEYLLLGGYMSLSLNDELFNLADEEFRTYLRGERGETSRTFAADAKSSLDQTLGSIHEQASSYESVKQSKTRDLSRLFAWAAHELETEPFDYDELLGSPDTDDDWLFDIDRRTLREKYFDTLEQMVLLTFSDGYGHKKPRELRVALRDVGLGNALLWRDLDDIHDAGEDLETSLEYMVAFDHVRRLSYNVNKSRDPNCGIVRYWQNDGEFIEFIPKIWGAPIPIGFDTTTDAPVSKIDAVGRFLDKQSADPDAEVHDFVRYEPAVGEPQTGPTGNLEKVLQWFDESVLEALNASDQVTDLNDLWNSSPEKLATIEGIDSETAQKLCDAVILYDMLSDVRGIGPSKQETLWNPPEENRPSPKQANWTVESLAQVDPERIAELPGFTATTAERVVEAARSQEQQEGISEYDRRLERLLEPDSQLDWPGIKEIGSDETGEYQGRYQGYEWGDKTGGSSLIHHRIHDGEAPFGIVLTSGSSVDRYESPQEEKPIFTVPLWMFLTLA